MACSCIAYPLVVSSADLLTGTDGTIVEISNPAAATECYCVELRGYPTSVALIKGKCSVDGESLSPSPTLLSPGIANELATG